MANENLKRDGKYIEYLKDSTCMPDIILVRSVLDVPSTSLGDICSKAKSGGRSGYAFDIRENAGSTGNLISGARPYWNLFSPKGPGGWYRDGLTIKHRLIDDVHFSPDSVADRGKYCFALESFKGYDHYAVAPQIGIDVEEIRFVVNETTPIFIPVTASVGSYPWQDVQSINGLALSVHNGLSHLQTKTFDYTTSPISHIFEIPKTPSVINNGDKITARLKLLFGQTAIDIIGLNADGSGISSKEVKAVGSTANAPELRYFSLFDRNNAECAFDSLELTLSGTKAQVNFILHYDVNKELGPPYKVYYYVMNKNQMRVPKTYYQDIKVNIVPGREQGITVHLPVALQTNDVVGINVYSS